ncbi:MAG TPA: peptidase C14 caspase catalytic subunit p20, partial [Phaeodactylibacter sp.]|nr:peptidase C14 caspase catalytic subunit p20 [Phaeodactylibacter sp.]
KYIGDFKDGEIHGIGICYYTDGSKYSGQWVHRFPEGKGTKTYADGSKRSGLWKKGQPIDAQGNIIEFTAKGEREQADDGTDIQTGCIKGDCKNGEGVFAYADGSRYEGQFKNGKLHGFGTRYLANGDKHVGSYYNNFPHGSGTLFLADGSQKEGEWVNGEYMGNAFREMGVEGCIKGDCINGEGTYIYQDGVAKYTGQFKNGLANGQGVCTYANGERYEGEWKDGSFYGYGTLHLLDGTKATGYWKEGTYVGTHQEETPPESSEVKIPADDFAEELTHREAINMKVWAVIIGVADYSHMPALKYTDDDAYRIYAYLKSPEGGALKDEQINILIDESATKENVLQAMKETFGKAGPNDLVFLYFSGHGLKGSFLPIDFDGFHNKLLHEEVNNILKSSRAKYKLCIADACHSGSLLAARSGTSVDDVLSKYYSTLAQADSGTALIMSSKSDETSLESSGLRQGVFSHFLIRGMKGEADANGNRVVSVRELYDFISENVRNYTGFRQSPVIKGDYDGSMTVGVVR